MVLYRPMVCRPVLNLKDGAYVEPRPIKVSWKEKFIMTLYVCNETNIITEEQYCGVEAGFCIVGKFMDEYKKELPRFNKVAGVKPYGLPYGKTPRKEYLGIGTSPHGYKHYAYEKHTYPELSEDYPGTEIEAMKFAKIFYSKKHCDVVWFRVAGSAAVFPDGYHSCGYDIVYPPAIHGAFSIINDCMFIVKWHGCDAEGTAFLEYYRQLNENGLFDNAKTAINYMKHYLSFDWSERGEYCICEIFRKI